MGICQLTEAVSTQRQTRPMLSRPLNIENNNQPILPTNVKRSATGSVLGSTQNLLVHSLSSEKKHEPTDPIKRSTVQDDIDNIQERLNEMLIAGPTTNENETVLQPTEQSSTSQYFTPKISINENGKEKIDEQDKSNKEEDGDDDDDDLDRKSKVSYSNNRTKLF